jgi:ABC-type glycerol-3-phosphate transport system substrate-binding protein
MMKNWLIQLKGFIIWVIVLFIACFSLYCNADQSGDPETVEITFWHSFVASTRDALDELIDNFEDINPQIKINDQYVPTGDALIQKLITAIQSKTAPDISWIHADFLDKLADVKAIYPMRKFIDGPLGLREDELNDIFQPLLESATWCDTLYALPMEATSLALFYNLDLFKKAGLDPDKPPRTWEELLYYTQKLTVDKDNDGKTDQYGFYVPVFPSSGPLNLWMILQWTPFLWQAGGILLSDDGSSVHFNRNPGVRALELWKHLYHEQDFENFSMSHDLGFASQAVAMIMDGPWNLPRYRQIKDFRWAVAPLPKGPARSATYLAGEHLVIFRQSDHPEKAWTFIKWILKPETQAKFSINSGYLPVNRSTLELASYRNYLNSHRAIKTFVDQIDSAKTRQLPKRHRVEFNRFIARAIEHCILGDENPQEALNEMAESAKGLIHE